MLSLSVVYSCLVGLWLLSKPVGPYKRITRHDLSGVEGDHNDE
jgi:hypothetical protein